MTNGSTVAEDAPWWELSGYSKHAACLIAARSGDRKALDALVVDLHPLVWRVARSHGLDQARAEDVVQTVWLTLLRNLDAVAQPKALARWLITTTKHEALRHLGHTNRVDPLTEDDTERLVSADGLPEEEALRSDRDRALWRAFHQLNSMCQELLLLTVVGGRAEYERVAEELHMPRGSIGPKRGRCLATLRTLYTSEGGTS